MRIRITGPGEKSAHTWYARFVGREFNVINVSFLGEPVAYTVNTIPLQESGEFSRPYAFVNAEDTVVVETPG